MTHEARLECTYGDADLARIVERSVRLEAGDIDGDRTSARVVRDGESVTVIVEADDLVALRAGCNTWLSLVSVAEDCAAA